MTPDSANDAVLKAYLLGDASPEERNRVEDRYVVDGELFDRLLVLEAELIDAYVEGELPPEEEVSFERSLAAMPRRRQRVQLVRDLAAHASQRAAVRPVTSSESGWHRWFQAPFRSSIVQWGLVAAVTVLAVSTGWMAREVASTQRRIRASEAARAQAEQTSEALKAEIGGSRANIAGTTTSATSESIVALALLPGLVRTGADEPPTVVITDDTLVLRLRLAVPDASEFPTYRGELRSAAGEERWTQTGLVASRVGSRGEVVVVLPASALTQGDFVLTLRQLSKTSLTEEYHFRATRR